MAPLKRYNNVHAYILDGNDEETAPTVRRARSHLTSIHKQKNDMIHSLLTELLECTVYSATFSITDKPADVYEFFENEAKSLSQGDLIIIYYDGEAGFEGEDYSWHFAGYPKKDVNATKIMKRINATDVDCLYLLDCPIPTRYLDERRRLHATTEIISAGHQLQSTKGVAQPAKDGDFTLNLVNDLDGYVERIVGASMAKVLERKPLSIPQIMRWTRRLTSNPTRVKFKEHDKATVTRIVFNPEDIKKTGKLRPFAKTIKFPYNTILAGEDEDEGIHMTDSQARGGKGDWHLDESAAETGLPSPAPEEYV